MAINKAMLINLLMNSAPLILSAIQRTPSTKYNPDPVPGISEALSRGYDAGLLDDEFSKEMAPYPGVLQAYPNEAIESFDMNLREDLDSKSTLKSLFPSDIYVDLLDTDDDYGTNRKIYNMSQMPKPAVDSAKVFQDPNNMKTLAQKLLTAKTPGIK